MCVCVCSSNSVRCQNQGLLKQDCISSGSNDFTEGLHSTDFSLANDEAGSRCWRSQTEWISRHPRTSEIQKRLAEWHCSQCRKQLRQRVHNSSQSPQELSASSFAPLDLIRTQSICLQNLHGANKSAAVCVLCTHWTCHPQAFHSPKLRPELAHHRCQSRFPGGGVLPAGKALEVILSSYSSGT